ncbi:hypothetical protein [Geothrix sp. PMB-07]|uniref:hypothetical protein n=1 Tax=Geothrix sp. PMB-07 TaxID=3068640 RepID=UPI002742797D|nr:hypothetical protein [Geothrix sp. PMB-07]WLT32770.1 hypothetical protein Q9293_05410 [Geothrix sp. PMB-07]
MSTDPKAWLQGGAKARPKHLNQAEAKAPSAKVVGGRPRAHALGAERINCRVAADVARELRVLQLDTKVALGLLVEEALRLALAQPTFRERFTTKTEVLL